MQEKVVLYGLGAFCVLLLAIASVIATDPPWNWGDVPTWVGGFVAGLALLAALWAGRTARDLLLLERQREDRAEQNEQARRDREERAEQADMIAAWIDSRGVSATGRGPVRGVRIGNASMLPIWAVTVRVIPTPGPRFEITKKFYPLVPPGGLFEAFRAGRVPDDEASVEIDFRDAAGRTWTRDRNGVLRKTGIIIYGEMAIGLSPVEFSATGTYTPPVDPEEHVDDGG